MPRQEKAGDDAASGGNQERVNSHAAMDFLIRHAKHEDQAGDRQERKEKCSEQDPRGPAVKRADLRAVEVQETQGHDPERQRCKQRRRADGEVTHVLRGADEL